MESSCNPSNFLFPQDAFSLQAFDMIRSSTTHNKMEKVSNFIFILFYFLITQSISRLAQAPGMQARQYISQPIGSSP